jgi:hypothetical protein
MTRNRQIMNNFQTTRTFTGFLIPQAGAIWPRPEWMSFWTPTKQI